MSILSLYKTNIPKPIQLPPELLTGVGAIDEEHRLLIAQLDYLRKAQDQTVDSEIMGECAHVIGRALMNHFKTEEEIMKRSTMPADEVQRHIQEHGRIIEEYVALQGTIMTMPRTKISDVTQTIENWIIGHAAVFDVPIKQYL